MRKLELLAPARNLECGIAAIDHGADAVYIGAPRFGARAAAGNSIDDIRELCRYAHQFRAEVYVTVNTIIYDEELADTYRLLQDLTDADVDAILVQDMGLLRLSRLFPIHARLPLHASTQTDNRTPEKVKWLRSQGFSRVVLARELSVEEIADIHRQVPDVELEVFVHGALCVSYSGLCYASHHCFGRSANRGECAQFCRMKFTLNDAEGRIVGQQRHLLSLKDLCLYDHLEELAEAGATSFKIEGRLKDLTYVKNVTAAYSQKLDEMVRKQPDKYVRSSRGEVRLSFKPDLRKTFNRGYTTYFLHGRQPDIASFDTPKAMGEYVGYVKEIRGNSFNVAGTAQFANGDGLCFINNSHELEGFRVNRVDKNRIFPLKMPSSLRPGTSLYRNYDQEFERLLSKPSAERKIKTTMSIRPSADGFYLTLDGVEINVVAGHQLAQTPQHDNLRRQLTRLGDTPYECSEVDIPEDFPYFIPSSQLSSMRRMVAHKASAPWRRLKHQPAQPYDENNAPPRYSLPYLYNIANHEAATFYEARGVVGAEAFEITPQPSPLIMQCRHCLRYSLGYCVKHGGKQPAWREPLCLQLGDGRRFRLEFDCRHCQMNIYAESSRNDE